MHRGESIILEGTVRHVQWNREHGPAPIRGADIRIGGKSYLPTPCDIGRVFRNRPVVEDLHNLRADYDRTLLACYERFERWAQRHSDVCPEQFVRMWRYYLLTYAACFLVRNRIQLWQIVLSQSGVPAGYRSIPEPGLTVGSVTSR